MPRLFFEVKSQQKADEIKVSIPKIVKVLERPPNTMEFYIEVNPLIEAEHLLFSYMICLKEEHLSFRAG